MPNEQKDPVKEARELQHERHPSLPKQTLCGVLITEVTLTSDRSVTCERCRDQSIERGVAAYFKRNGLDRRFDLRGLLP